MRKLNVIISAMMLLLSLTVQSTFVYSDDRQKEEKENTTEKKVAYLTFDDGPTKTTEKILDVLEKSNVKATFFVIGTQVESNSKTFQRIIDSGSSVCVHTYNHEKKNYRSKELFLKDNKKCFELIEDVVGRKPEMFFRFPGGSSNRVASKFVLREIRKEAVNKGLYYVDWNVCINDSLGRNIPCDTLIRSFQKEFKNQKRVIVLMHDGYYNKTTVDTLPYIIRTLKEKGYEFNTFNNITNEEFKALKVARLINRYD